MRVIDLAAGLIALAVLLPGLAHGFAIEEERTFAASAGGGPVLRVISTADLDIFAPLIEAFQAKNRSVNVHYVTASSAEVMKAIYKEDAPFDVAISSAMDLQTKLANDGYALAYRSAVTEALPDWARWRDRVFAFTQEPAVAVMSKQGFEGLRVPRTRDELIATLRENPERFQGRVGTYDVRESGLGYLFATQDSRQSESFWRMAEVMGRLHTRLYCCSGQMIDDVASGELALAYNVLGSYANKRLKDIDAAGVIVLGDYTNVMLRSALVPRSAASPDLGGRFIDFLTDGANRSVISGLTGLPALDPDILEAETAYRPIRLGPGLLVFLDQMKRRAFLRAWLSAMVQP